MKTTNSIFIDHYKNLGVEFTASMNDIKKAFRKLAKVMHPDTPTGDKISFTNLYCSYETLSSNPDREVYDQSYLKFYAKQKKICYDRLPPYKHIPSTRLHYPAKISTLAQYWFAQEKKSEAGILNFF